ncbi:MAG: hypothetical protein ACOY4U_04530 [Pseudomonadota bacterium]
MNDSEKKKAFSQARREALKGRTAILRDTHAEIMRLLKLAQAEIAAVLAGQPSDYQLWMLPQISKEISVVMARFGDAGAATLSTASGKAWQAGQGLIDVPLAAAGFALAGVAPSIDTRQLLAMRAFMTDRIKDVGVAAANKINSELGLVVIGARAPGDAIGRVTEILGDQSRARATTIVRTELGRVYAVAAQARMEQAGELVPGLKKQWRRSGKIHSRLNHDLADGQIRERDQPFNVGGRQIMHPHDPKAPASETINCGCVAIPYMDSWEMATPGRKPYTADELRLNVTKRMLRQAA